MASGYFPLSSQSPEGRRLLDAAAEIAAVWSEMYNLAREQDKTDDVFYDGGSCAKLGEAVRLVREQVTVYPKVRA